MYVGKKKFEKTRLPKVNRDMEFSDNDFWEEANSDSVNYQTKRLAESLPDGLMFLYPIVWYSPNNMIFFNRFIENVVVALVGRRQDSISKNVVMKVKVFVTKPLGEVEVLDHADDEFAKFLCKKPNLIVSKEGVLVFYNDKKIIATLDMDEWNSVTIEELSEVLNDETICGIRELTIDSNSDIHLNFFGTGGINALPAHHGDCILKTSFSFIDSVRVTLEINPAVHKDSAEEKNQQKENLLKPEVQPNSQEKLKDETEDDEDNLPKPGVQSGSTEQSEGENANKPKEDVPIIQTLTTNNIGM